MYIYMCLIVNIYNIIPSCVYIETRDRLLILLRLLLLLLLLIVVVYYFELEN